MEKSLFKPFLTVFALMVVASLALAFTVNVRLEDQPGVVMKIPDTLPGGWVGNEMRFCHNKKCYPTSPSRGDYYIRDLEFPDICPDCGEKLYTMSWAEYDALPKDTEFTKSVYTNAAGERMFTSIVLSGRERNSIHRPERCLVGQGYTIMGEYVLDVPLPGRKPLKVLVAKLERLFGTQSGEKKAYYSYYAYWFVGQDRETPSHYARLFWMGWDQVVRSVAHRWAYIAISSEREKEGTAYEQQIIDFVQKLYPKILVKDSPLRWKEPELPPEAVSTNTPTPAETTSTPEEEPAL
jgi:hypothetical protein